MVSVSGGAQFKGDRAERDTMIQIIYAISENTHKKYDNVTIATASRYLHLALLQLTVQESCGYDCRRCP